MHFWCMFFSALSLLPRFRAELLDLQSLYCISKKSNPWTRRVDFQKIESDAKKDKLWKTPRNIEKSPKSSYFFEMEGKKIGPHFFLSMLTENKAFFLLKSLFSSNSIFERRSCFENHRSAQSWHKKTCIILNKKNLVWSIIIQNTNYHFLWFWL